MKRFFTAIISGLVIFSMFFSFNPISGQGATYSISGRVTDGSGFGVAGVIMLAERAYDNQIFLPLILQSNGGSQSNLSVETRSVSPSAVTDANGYYSIESLSGTYVLRAVMEGVDFLPSEREVDSTIAESQDFEVLILDPVITDNTKILTDESNQYLDPAQSDRTVFTFTQTTTELEALDVGDIMVSGVSENAPDGYLRKVTDIAYSGGAVSITTEPATLEEAILDGSVFIQETLRSDQVTSVSALPGVTMLPSSERAPYTFYFQIEDVVLYDHDDDLSTKYDQIRANGSIEFDMDFVFYLYMQNSQVKRFSLTNENAITNTLEIFSELELAGVKKEHILATQYFSPIKLMAGPVPIVFVPKLDLVVGVDGSVKVGVSTEVSNELSMKAGIQYHYSSGWSPIADIDYTFTYKPPHLTFEMSLKGYLGPRFNLYLYGVAGPYVNITRYLEIKVEPLESPWWTLYGGIDVPVGFRVIDKLAKILDLDEYEVVAIGIKQVIAQASSMSPQGQLAFIRDGNIWLINTEDLSQIALTTSGNYKEVFWSPDGEKLAYIHNVFDPVSQKNADEIGIYDLGNDSETIIVPKEKTGTILDRYYDYYYPRWSKDSSTLYFIKQDERVGGRIIHTVNVKTHNQNEGFENFRSLRFDVSPINNRIVFIYFSNAIPSGQYLNLANGDGSDRYPLFPILEGVGIQGVTWNPDGKSIIFSARGGEFGEGSIVKMLPEATIQETWLADSAASVTISPDSSHIAYESNNEIFLLNLATGEVEYLITGTSPSWNPN